MDLIDPLKKTTRGNRYILMTCYFRWAKLFILLSRGNTELLQPTIHNQMEWMKEQIRHLNDIRFKQVYTHVNVGVFLR